MSHENQLAYVEGLIKLAKLHNLQTLAVGNIQIVPGRSMQNMAAMMAAMPPLAKQPTDEEILRNPFAGLSIDPLAREDAQHG